MMSKRSTYPETPKWMFAWKPLGTPNSVKLMSLLIPAGLFALVVTSLQVTVSSPDPWVPVSASVMRALPGTDGGGLALWARENGPFPARWASQGDQGRLDPAIHAALSPSWRPPVLQPRPLPETEIFPGISPAEDGRVFPPLPPATPLPELPTVRTQPSLVALGGISQAELPTSLPPLGSPANDPLAGETGRFLVRVRGDGSVIDAIPLAGGDEASTAGAARLADWFRAIRFPAAADGSHARILGIGVRFLNQPADAPESR